MTEKLARKEVMRRALKIEPTVYIGKCGLKSSVCDEIKGQLKKNRLIKMRVLSRARDKDDGIIDNVAKMTQSVIVDVRGNVAIITDKRTWKSLCQKKFEGV
ncbi:MAG: YhbY family RNA-binding protein [archaeon]|nr:YhbY family RNA-binding protein [archaeon]